MKSIFLTTLLVLISCSQTVSRHSTNPVKLTILHTNDHHGRFWSNKDGEYGLAARATLINSIKKEVINNGGEVLLLDAGDVNTGVPQSDLLDAEPDFKAMAAIGYDVMALGNHEFDKPLKTIFKQQKNWANFPFVSANIYDSKGERIFPSHVTKIIKGQRVVIFGLTTEDTPKKSRPENSKGLIFRPVVEEARNIVPELRKNADVLIALTHTGHYPDGKHGADAPGDVSIARAVEGIDLIVGGHTQKPLFKPDIINGTIIVQAYEWGKYVGRIDLEISENEVRLMSYELIPVNLKSSTVRINPDKKIEDLLRPYKEKGDKFLLVPIGVTDEEFQGQRDVVRQGETNLGNLITLAYKDKFKADLAIINSGGIRDSLYPGQITLESVLMVLPFAGEIVTTTMSGKELTQYFQHLVRTLTPGSGSYPQIAGIELTIDRKNRVIRSLKVNGQPVGENQTYVMALPEFIAQGGDKFPVIDYRKYGYGDADILKEYIQKKKTLRARDYAPTGYIQWDN